MLCVCVCVCVYEHLTSFLDINLHAFRGHMYRNTQYIRIKKYSIIYMYRFNYVNEISYVSMRACKS